MDNDAQNSQYGYGRLFKSDDQKKAMDDLIVRLFR